MLLLQGLALQDESGNIPDHIQTGGGAGETKLRQELGDFDGGTLQKEGWLRLEE